MPERFILIHEYLVDLVSLNDLPAEEEDRALDAIGVCELALFYGVWPRALLTDGQVG